MCVYDGRTDRQSESETMVLRGKKRFKQTLVIQGTYAMSSILYQNLYGSSFMPRVEIRICR